MRRLFAPLAFAAALALALAPTAQAEPDFTVNPATVFINEIHYDNTGADAGEFVEIAGPAGLDVTGWTVVLYNGSGGVSYAPLLTFAGVIPDQCGGFGTLQLPAAGLQNGAPDGLALVNAANVVQQFLSYEGAFAATNGPANTLTSTNVGVAQNGTEPVGTSSLHLIGTGRYYQHFTWAATTTSRSAGACNTGQTFDATGPAVTINQAAGQVDPATSAAAPVVFDVVFNEVVTDFADADVTLSGTAGATTAVVAGAGTTYTVSVTGMTTNGTVIASLNAGVASDAYGNTSSASTSADNTVTIADPVPTVTINQAVGQADPTGTSPILFDVVFSETVTGFATGDVSLSGTAGATTATVSGAGTTYSVSVSGMTVNGTVIAAINAGVATDSFGQANLASTSVDNSVTFADPAPTVTSINRVGATPTAGPNVSWTVTFSEAVSGVAAGNFALVNGGLSGPAITGVSGSGSSWTVTANVGSGSGTLGLDMVNSGGVSDGFGSAVSNLPFAGQVFAVDTSVPAVVGIVGVPASVLVPGAITFTVTFNQAVTGVDASDFALTLGGGAAATIGAVSGSGTTWTVVVNVTAAGSVQLDLVDDDSISNGLGTPLGGAGAGNGNASSPVVGGFVPAAPVPALGPFGLGLLMLLAGLLGVVALQRRNT